jgi:alpha-beta hydrolase superfamily lysophospholipase
VIHGGADELVPTAGSEPLAAVPGVERRVVPNLRHETLNEPEGPQVVAGVVDWLRAHVP